LVTLINSLQLDSESINTWKNGVARALKRYVADGQKQRAKNVIACNSHNLIYQEDVLPARIAFFKNAD